MSTRSQNERKFGHWEEMPHGGRRYWLEVAGRRGWKARYVKEVNTDENSAFANRTVLVCTAIQSLPGFYPEYIQIYPEYIQISKVVDIFGNDTSQAYDVEVR